MWEAIRSNRRQSAFLVFGMAALFVAVGASVGGAWGDPWIGLGVASAVWVVLTLFAWYGGGWAVLAASRAKRITHADAPQLFNVAEEMSIASGLPMPKVYIVDDTAPNAFATGRNPETASIAVTRGLLDKLKRDELQGVVAHEMAHVRNRDCLYMTLIGVLLGTIVLVCDVFLRATWWGAGRRRSSRGKGGSAQLVMMIVALVLAILAPIIARIMYFAISRKREYLADASAAELTRYPEALASALEKISADKEVLEVANRATAHLYIVNPIKPFEARYSRMGSTHPPIAERVKILRAMSGGASVKDYEAARLGVGAGPRRNLVKKRTLREAEKKPVPLRATPRTGTRSPEELMAELERLLGPVGPLGGSAALWYLLCSCGAPVLVPGGPVAGGIVQCMGCGGLHDVAKESPDMQRFARDGALR